MEKRRMGRERCWLEGEGRQQEKESQTANSAMVEWPEWMGMEGE